MPGVLYHHLCSTPSRAARLTATALGLEDLELKEVDLLAGEHLGPQYTQINPQHCVPTLVEDDFILWESRAVMAYLVGQYGEDDVLYPSDPRTRAKVDRLLYFDMGTLYHRYSKFAYPVVLHGESPDASDLEKVQEALGWLDTWLGESGGDWAVGDHITIADHSLASTLATIEATDIDLSQHSTITAYMERCKTDMPGYNEFNVPGAQVFGGLFLARTK